MKNSEIDQLIANYAKAALAGKDPFENLSNRDGMNLNFFNRRHLKSRLHDPPPVHPDIDEKKLRLGQWMAVCQYVIFEIIYRLDRNPIRLLKSIAFGEYDWTQANALTTLCRLYLDGKIAEDIIIEIDRKLSSMRYETHLYFGRDLLLMSKKDARFNEILKKLNNADFREALEEIRHRDEGVK